jgi:hypothetical protein
MNQFLDGRGSDSLMVVIICGLAFFVVVLSAAAAAALSGRCSHSSCDNSNKTSVRRTIWCPTRGDAPNEINHVQRQRHLRLLGRLHGP